MIELNRVTAHRGGGVALREVSLHVPRGTVTALIGPNGAGKSTLFGLLSGRLRPTSGTVSVAGEVAEVLQATSVDPQLSLTVHDVVCIGRYPSCGRLRRLGRHDRQTVTDAIAQVELEQLDRRPFGQLSGGQRQRALIAQGLAQDADVLLLDEPSAGLDAVNQRRILDIVRGQADQGRTVVFSTHHLPDAAHADLVIALDCSCVCCAGPAEAMDDPAVRALFDPFASTVVDGPWVA